MNLSHQIADKVLIASFLQTAAATPQVPLEEWQVIAIAIGAGCVGAIAETLRESGLKPAAIIMRIITCSFFCLAMAGGLLIWIKTPLTALPVAVTCCGVGLFAWPLSEKARTHVPRLFGDTLQKWGKKK